MSISVLIASKLWTFIFAERRAGKSASRFFGRPYEELLVLTLGRRALDDSGDGNPFVTTPRFGALPAHGMAVGMVVATTTPRFRVPFMKKVRFFIYNFVSHLGETDSPLRYDNSQQVD